MAGRMAEDGRSLCNWKDLVMLNHFLRPKVLGVTGSATIEEVDVYMRPPAELFGSEPAWKRKFFFTNRFRIKPRADRGGAKLRGGYWLRAGSCEIIKGTDGTRIGSKQRLVFREGMFVKKDSKKTKWCMNEYRIFEEQALENKDLNEDNKKKETWILCELFQTTKGAEDKDSKAFPAVNPTLAVGDPPSEATSTVPVPSESEGIDQRPGVSDGGQGDEQPFAEDKDSKAFPAVNPTLAAGDQPSEATSTVPVPSESEGIDQRPGVSDGGQGDEQPFAWSGHEWIMNKRIKDYTSQDYDDFTAVIEELLGNPPDFESGGLQPSE